MVVMITAIGRENTIKICLCVLFTVIAEFVKLIYPYYLKSLPRRSSNSMTDMLIERALFGVLFMMVSDLPPPSPPRHVISVLFD